MTRTLLKKEVGRNLNLKKMKKLIYGSLFLAAVGIGLIGCKKENLPISAMTNSDISSDGKMLIFESVESFEKSVEDLTEEKRIKVLSEISKQNFKSYLSIQHSISKTDSDSIQEMDDFLGQLLNEDGIIQIGNFIYKVNLQSNKVFVLPVSNSSEYQDLVDENKSNKNIRQFSTSDDVIYLAENGEAGEKCGGIGSFDNSSPVVNLDNDGQIKFDANCKYFQGGIYFRVTGRVEYTPAFSGTAKIALEIQSPQAWMRRRPCGDGTVTIHHAGERVSGFYYRYLFEAYSKTRAINGIYMFVRARAEITPPGQSTIIKYTNWTGRNVNSPY